MSGAIRAYIDRVHEDDKEVLENEGVLKLLSATQLIVGSGIASIVNGLVSGRPDQSQSTQVFWDDPENYDTLCEMESAEATVYHGFVAELPSFSIGLTLAEKNGFDNGVEVDLFNTKTPSSLKKDERVVNVIAQETYGGV